MMFTLRSNIHNYNTAASSAGKLFNPSFQTNLHGKNSISATNAGKKNANSLWKCHLEKYNHQSN